MKIVLATKNQGKVREFKNLFKGMNVEILSILDGFDIPEIVEDGKTFEENSFKKAYEVMEATGHITISDDSGLCIDAFDGNPGIYTSRWFSETDDYNERCKKMIEKLDEEISENSEKTRNANFVCVITIVFPNGEKHHFRGEVFGEILKELKGIEGHGYDPIFYSKELGKSFGESSIEEKESVSHRARAFSELKKFLKFKLEN